MKLAWQWRNFGLTFPIMDMEAGLLRKMTACLNVYDAVKTRVDYVLVGGKTDSEFRKNYPQYAPIWRDIKELRETNGKSQSSL